MCIRDSLIVEVKLNSSLSLLWLTLSLSLSLSLTHTQHTHTHTHTHTQVEDRDKTDVLACWGPLTEFTRGLLDYSPPIDPPAFSQSNNRPYKPSDSMIHYAYIFKQLRRPTTAAAAAGLPMGKTSSTVQWYTVQCHVAIIQDWVYKFMTFLPQLVHLLATLVT